MEKLTFAVEKLTFAVKKFIFAVKKFTCRALMGHRNRQYRFDIFTCLCKSSMGMKMDINILKAIYLLISVCAE